MKRLLSLVALAGVFAIVPRVQGADLTGTWKGAFDYQGQSMPLTFHLTAAGDAVTGSIEGLPASPIPIHDGKIEGDKVSFWANVDYQDDTYKLVFTGQISSAPEGISFTMGTDDGSWSTELLAQRSSAGDSPQMDAPQSAAPQASDAQPEVNGTWQGSFDFQGDSVPVTLHLASTGDAVSGTVEGMVQGTPEKPLEIHDGKIADGTLTFWVNTDYQGETYKIVYKGAVAAGKISFTFGTDDGSWTSDMTVSQAQN